VPVSATQPATAPPVQYPLPDPIRRERNASVPSTFDAEAPPHPWSVRKENGAWMICVRAYSGPESLKMAEKLCREIRETHKVASFIYSRNAEELRRERALVEAIRQKEIDKNQPFLKAVAEAKKVAEAEGRTFEESPIKLRSTKPFHEAPEQWAVFIGGFPTDEAARKALNIVRKLPPPKDPELMDLVADTAGKAEGVFLNPFINAMVISNPAIAKAKADEKYKLEPFLVKLNQDVKYSLLKAKKPWTLQVKAFTTPMRVVSKDNDADNVFTRTLGTVLGGSKKSMLEVTAEQAEQLATSLRNPEMKPTPFESFVLHHRTGSLVLVGQYDAPNDPELIRVQTLLQGMTFMMETADGKKQVQRMFDGVSPMPVPLQ